jgi:hypothetical protein
VHRISDIHDQMHCIRACARRNTRCMVMQCSTMCMLSEIHECGGGWGGFALNASSKDNRGIVMFTEVQSSKVAVMRA